MGEEDRRCDVDMAAAAEEEEEEEEKVVEMEMEEGSRVREWEAGLPGADDLMPLSQLLIPPELANAFSVSPEPRRSSADVHSASRHTLSSIRRRAAPLPFPGGNEPAADEDGEEDPGDGGGPAGEEEEESRKTRREDSATTTDDAESESGGGGHAARAAKRPRLVWTPQLHKRFVDVVTHLGIKKAVPKTIMQLMNVEGLTRENVASHLQKYRLYLKRQGLPYDGASTSDYSQSGDVDAAAGMSLPVPMQHGPPLLPMQSMNHHPSYHGFHSHPFGSMLSYPHAARRGRSEDDIGYPISQ